MWRAWLDTVEPVERVLRRRPVTIALAVVEITVLLLAALPFALFYGFGPQRFDDTLQLGGVPTLADPVAQPTDGDGLGAPPEVGLPPDGVDRLARDIGLDLGPNVRVTLVFSVGSRALTEADAERLRVNDLDARGSDGLTDVIMLVIADPDTGRVALLSLPRDYFLRSKDERINVTWENRGTQGLVDDVGLVTGLPIHHVALVNFRAFAELVDRLGGVAMRTDRTLADLESVLWVPGPGCWLFQGADALAYVRSRNTITRNDSDRFVTDTSASDFGRIARQQQLLAAAFDQLRGPQAIARVPDLLSVARDGLIVDQGLGLQQVRGLLEAFQNVTAGTFEGYTIPANHRRIDGKAVLVGDEDAARPIMERLRSWPPEEPLALPTDAPSADSEVYPVGEVAVDTACTADDAAPLPEPFAPLAQVARSRPRPAPSPSTAPSSRPTATPMPTATTSDQPSESAPPSSEPTPTESEPTVAPQPTRSPTPSESPSPTSSPSPSPTSDPAPSPSPSPTESDTGILPQP